MEDRNFMPQQTTDAENGITTSLRNIEKMINTVFGAESIVHDQSKKYTDEELRKLRIKKNIP